MKVAAKKCMCLIKIVLIIKIVPNKRLRLQNIVE